MAGEKPIDIEAAFENEQLILAAIRQGTLEAMKRHIAGGVPMVSWKDGHVVEIPVEKLIEIVNREQTI